MLAYPATISLPYSAIRIMLIAILDPVHLHLLKHKVNLATTNTSVSFFISIPSKYNLASYVQSNHI